MKNAFLGIVLLLSGCMYRPSATMTELYSTDAHEHFKLVGDTGIHGQAFLRQVGGGIVTCAGGSVQLFPDTPYFREFNTLRNYNIVPENFNPASRSLIRQAKCDSQGNFKFENLPAAKWIIRTNVSWGIPTTYYIDPQGGDMYEFTETKSGTTDIIMSH